MTSINYVARIYGEKSTLEEIIELFGNEDTSSEVADEFGDCSENYLGLLGFYLGVMDIKESEELARRAFVDDCYLGEDGSYVLLYYRTSHERGKEYWEEIVKRSKGITKIEAFADPAYPEYVEEVGSEVEVYSCDTV